MKVRTQHPLRYPLLVVSVRISSFSLLVWQAFKPLSPFSLLLLSRRKVMSHNVLSYLSTLSCISLLLFLILSVFNDSSRVRNVFHRKSKSQLQMSHIDSFSWSHTIAKLKHWLLTHIESCRFETFLCRFQPLLDHLSRIDFQLVPQSWWWKF